MTAAQNMLRRQFRSINGLQDTLLAPVRDKNGKWIIPENSFNKVLSPSVQIHYTGYSHWVMTFKKIWGQ